MIPPWLLLPASGRSAAPAALVAALAERSSGQVAAPGGAVSGSRDLAAELVAELDRAGIGRAVGVGLSFGGQRTQALLQHHPQRVAGVVLVASGAPDRARAAALARRRWLWRWSPRAARDARERLLASDRDGADQPGAFASFRAPVVVIELGADAVIAKGEAARVRSLFPQARVERLAGLTHDAVVRPPPALVAAVVAAVIAAAAAAAAD